VCKEKGAKYYMVYRMNPYTGALSDIVTTTNDENEAKRIVDENNDNPQSEYKYDFRHI